LSDELQIQGAYLSTAASHAISFATQSKQELGLP
jgi:hypothetical protein